MDLKQQQYLLSLYKRAKSLPKGSDIQCAWCGDEVKAKHSHRSAFCRNHSLGAQSCGQQFYTTFSPQHMKDGVYRRDLSHPAIERNRARS